MSGLERVVIAGQDVDCLDVNAVITHGRTTVTDGPTPSSAAVTIYRAATMPTWVAGDPIKVYVHGGRRRFTGTVTDIDITGHPDTDRGRVGQFTVQAAGTVATLGAREVGDTPWPVESSADRARHILGLTGVPYTVEGDPSLKVTARDVDRQPALSLITSHAGDVGAAVFDTPSGAVVFQHYSARAQTWHYTRWLDAPGVWSEQDGWFANWDATAEQSPNAPLPIPLDMCAVGWEPVWRSVAVLYNSVRLGYGPTPADAGTRPAWHLTDPASVSRFGRKHYANETTSLADLDSAMERAGMILDLHSQPHWAIDNVLLYLDSLASPSDVGLMLDLLCGARVQLTNLPQPAPEWSPVRIVEGWTHTLTKTRSTLLLHLSDPLQSYAGITWSALAPDVPRWQDVPPAVVWADALTVPILTAVGGP